ncbi:Hsp70 family protein [Nioella nitratireducens]|uniref:Hsp70 family protein n=1 Tax=Nioella nitratireducens TaxID=1287720 RepID=UPI0008FD1FB5|nr:Hsp70 family protein [Nioella nitratireducens]
MQTQTLAIDFGTSNTAAAVPFDHGIYRIPVERGAETLPTAVFFPAEGGTMRIGVAAAEALVAGDDGRYMRALKSVLGLPLLQEERLVGGKRRSLSGIITAFLTELRQRAETATGLTFRTALSGRPVHFHTADLDKDAQAEADLRACYLAAGFDAVSFLAEPEAAAIACQGMGAGDEIGLIVDIGGGTSDFSVFRNDGARPRILANHGIRLGGTDFDQALSLAHAMPVLGLGSELRRDMGAGLLPVPRAPYVDLATWAKIPFLYTPETRRMAAEMARLAVEPEKMARLVTVLDNELGHDLAFAVERAKIGANGGRNEGRIAMGSIERGLSAPVTPDDLEAVLSGHRTRLTDAARETLTLAGIAPGDVGRIILVGGSSLMRIVSDEMQALCPNGTVLRSEAFTAVVDGLALAAKA